MIPTLYENLTDHDIFTSKKEHNESVVSNKFKQCIKFYFGLLVHAECQQSVSGKLNYHLNRIFD